MLGLHFLGQEGPEARKGGGSICHSRSVWFSVLNWLKGDTAGRTNFQPEISDMAYCQLDGGQCGKVAINYANEKCSHQEMVLILSRFGLTILPIEICATIRGVNMRRLCFDTESSFYLDWRHGILSVESLREHFRDQNIRFYCGVVYEESADKYFDFRQQEAAELVSMLSGADEIISHSGSRADLIVLEHACGEDRLAQFRQLKHHDLFYLCNAQSLDSLTTLYAPDRIPAWKADLDKRLEQAWALGIESRSIPISLAKARYDVERTYAVFWEISRLRNL